MGSLYVIAFGQSCIFEQKWRHPHPPQAKGGLYAFAHHDSCNKKIHLSSGKLAPNPWQFQELRFTPKQQFRVINEAWSFTCVCIRLGCTIINSLFQEASNIARGKSAKMLSHQFANSANRALDGKLRTLALSGALDVTPMWFYVDLGATARINHTRIYNRQYKREFATRL